jgi:hypothetical protein
MSDFGDLARNGPPADAAGLRALRVKLVAGWFLLSAWEAVPIYLAFMRRSENPSPEVAVALAAATCWMPVVGTAAAVMAAVWAWDMPWWAATAAFLAPKALFVLYARAVRTRAGRPPAG